MTWASVRLPWGSDLIKSEPTLLVHRGAFLKAGMRKQRVTEAEVMSVLRADGISAIDEAFAVVLETDGSFSIVEKPSTGATANALANVAGFTGEPVREAQTDEAARYSAPQVWPPLRASPRP